MTLSFLPSEWDYCDNCQLNKLFDFVKDLGIFYIFAWESINFHAVLNVFCDFQLFLKIFSTHFTSHCPKCLFHMNNHKDPSSWVISVDRISRLTKPWGNINKKTYFFYYYSKAGFSHFRQILQNLGLKEMSGFPSSPMYSVKT